MLGINFNLFYDDSQIQNNKFHPLTASYIIFIKILLSYSFDECTKGASLVQ